MNRHLIMMAAAGALVVTAGAAEARTVYFHANLAGTTEVPPTTSPGTGTAMVSLNTSTRKLTYTVTYQGLTGPATAAHIHGPAATGKNGPVMTPLGPAASSPIKGTATATAAEVKAMEGGMTYVNVHTQQNPGGEIRGQLMRGK